MLVLANHRRLLLTLLASAVTLLVIFHSTTSSLDSSSSLLSSTKDALSSSFDFDWSTTSNSSVEELEDEEEEEKLAAKVEGEGEMRSPLYREFEGRPFVELNERSPFAEVAILGDECLELCECFLLIRLDLYLLSHAKEASQHFNRPRRKGRREGKVELNSADVSAVARRSDDLTPSSTRCGSKSRAAIVSSDVVPGYTAVGARCHAGKATQKESWPSRR